MKNRLILILMALSFVLIIMKAFQVQILEHEKHKKYIDLLQTRLVKIPAPRGRIISSDGKVLAKDEVVYVLDPWLNSIDELKKTELFTSEEILSLVKGESIVIDKARADVLSKAGVRVVMDYRRKYEPLAPHVVGYVNADRTGVYGVESVYDELLTGTDGMKMVFVEPSGAISSEVLRSPPKPGEDVTLTIDSRIQKVAEESLEKTGNPGSVILSDVRTGEILVLASFPGYNPQDFYEGFTKREWERLARNSPSPLVNRAISSAYSPGSSIKVLWAIAALLNGVDPEEKINCRGVFDYRNSKGEVVARYKDWKEEGHGLTDLRKAIRVSCNVYFYQLGLKIGVDKMVEVAKKLGIFEKTGIDLPGEKNGTLPTPEWKMSKIGEPWYPGDTILMSIGQGYLTATPMELLKLVSLVANEGIFYRPHVVKKIGSKAVKPEIETQVQIDEKIWTFIKDAMVDVTSFKGNEKEDPGTAYHVFGDFPYRVAGKTGTAETGSGAPHSWFIGFAPAENPEVAIVTMVEHGGYGSGVAAQIAREVLEEYFKLKESAQETPASSRSRD
ncbi:penicillin-binding transpeptidase domain-containing protein [Thermotoga sp. 38H-to]|uniref:penicillin-binding transpeptidase domain-containing protein n=1 Tax=Thermotoga sp. 38H-to TaxID=1755812 RepID=UPI0013E9CA32|nr:penicillin-binding transpeptidase domain-containing protein [Thermotoga sp. 38H-to]KAF2959911.1 penicillin-binding protein [Thermotoga sp. 38H-to]